MSSKPARLVTDVTDPAKTASMIIGGICASQAAGGKRHPLAKMSVSDITWLSALVLYALGEVYERQFYPSDREQCQELARVLLGQIGVSAPDEVVLPGRSRR